MVPESDPEPGLKFPEQSDPNPDPEKIIWDPQHGWVLGRYRIVLAVVTSCPTCSGSFNFAVRIILIEKIVNVILLQKFYSSKSVSHILN